jgi:hypothetical protein
VSLRSANEYIKAVERLRGPAMRLIIFIYLKILKIIVLKVNIAVTLGGILIKNPFLCSN